MSNFEVYFKNHEKATKFPWSIYHAPLYQDLLRAIDVLGPDASVLVIGPGAFPELGYLLARGHKVSVLDIDPRVLQLHKERSGQVIDGFYLVDADFNGYPERDFDFIYAKEVIEHLALPEKFLRKLFSCLKTDGSVWLSTPNYGFFLLPLLETTFLELVARLSGFSRKNIHPSRFSADRLAKLLNKSGFKEVKVSETPMKLALTAQAKKIS